jgi:hypothetical protein
MLHVMDVSATELKRAVEAQHGCKATVFQSVPIKETFGRNTVWEGVVHIFSLTGHPTAKRAYAWSSPIEGSDKRRFFAVLHQSPVTSPVEAVRAAIVAEHKDAALSEDRVPRWRLNFLPTKLPTFTINTHPASPMLKLGKRSSLGPNGR